MAGYRRDVGFHPQQCV